MDFQVGEKVVHSTFGLGEVIQVDEKVISGKRKAYYVVQVNNMTVWVPKNDGHPESLRYITPASEFKKAIKILSSPCEALPGDRFDRKNWLSDHMKDGGLASICQVVRDLNNFKQTKKMNDNDVSMLERAEKLLINEWQISLSIPCQEAEEEMRRLLGLAIETEIKQ